MAKPGAVEPLDAYLDALASPAATPGGGSAAGLVGATAAALVAMVARICLGNPKYADAAPLAATLAGEADGLRAALLESRERDEAAYARVVTAQALPKSTEAERAARAEALAGALAAAAAEPLRAAGLALETLRRAERLLAIPNRHLASDVGCAAEFAAAALGASAYNVRVNDRLMRDPATAAAHAAALDAAERESAALLGRVRAAVAAALAPSSPPAAG